MAFDITIERRISGSVFSPRIRGCVFGLLLAAVTILVYRPAWNGGFLWDDDEYVINNDLLTASDGLRRIWFSLDSPSQYFPLTYSTFRIEHALWGLNTTGYHWVNLLLHVANAMLVWRLLACLKVPGAWLAGASPARSDRTLARNSPGRARSTLAGKVQDACIRRPDSVCELGHCRVV